MLFIWPPACFSQTLVYGVTALQVKSLVHTTWHQPSISATFREVPNILSECEGDFTEGLGEMIGSLYHSSSYNFKAKWLIFTSLFKSLLASLFDCLSILSLFFLFFILLSRNLKIFFYVPHHVIQNNSLSLVPPLKLSSKLCCLSKTLRKLWFPRMSLVN